MKEGTCTLQAQDDVFEEQHSQGIEKVVQAAKMQEEIDEHLDGLFKRYKEFFLNSFDFSLQNFSNSSNLRSL